MFVFFVVEEKTLGKTNDNWNFWIRFCGPKMAVSWRICFFKKKLAETPYFYSVLGVRAFWAKLSKKGKFWTPTQKKKNLTDNWKAHFF